MNFADGIKQYITLLREWACPQKKLLKPKLEIWEYYISTAKYEDLHGEKQLKPQAKRYERVKWKGSLTSL